MMEIQILLIANLKVINGDNTDFSVLPLPSWKVDISAKKEVTA